MTATLPLKKLLILAFPIFFMACSPNPSRLPDDPQNEPYSEPTPQPDVNQDFPSTGEDLTPMPGSSTEPLEGKDAILANYDYVDPNHIVPTKALEQAILYFDENKASLKNTKVLSIIDFSQSSTQKRWYFIDMETGAVWNIHVAHGKGSDSDHDGFAEKFSNVNNSNATSLGFYKTAETYQGSHGYSLRLDGLSSTNSNARSRSIVVHGASYVEDKERIQGRSWGCPAVSMANYTKVINLIKGGSLILAVN
jgi:hypothetical protein